MPIRLKQIIIFCVDVQKIAQFYKQCFNLSTIGNFDNHWVVLDSGETQIALHKIGDEFLPPNQDFRVEDSNVKLVFEIDDHLEKFKKT